MDILALSGKKGSGKDFLGNFLCQERNYTRIAFADPLKKAIEEIFSLNHDQLYGSDKEKEDIYWGVSPRWLMTTIGTEMFRDFFGLLMKTKGIWSEEEKANIWVKCAEKKIQVLREKGLSKFVITDLRFKNEANWVKKNNGVIININRPQNTSSSDHISETDLSEEYFDHTFLNDDESAPDRFLELVSEIRK